MRIEPAMSDRTPEVVAAEAADRWFAVQSRPHQEDRAIVHLSEQGYRSFCPRLRRTVRHARRATVVLTPLFPG
jgi:transcriptional antiterminator RfaH